MVKGVVDRVSEKAGKFGTMYSVKLRDTDTWYGLKGAKPRFVEGNLIEFEAHQNARGYWDADGRSVRVLEATVAAAPAARAVAGAQPVGKDDYWKRKEERDLTNDQLRNIGAARNTAIAFVDLLAKYEAVKLPKTQADREKALLAAVEHYRKEFMSEVVEEPVEESEEIPYEAPAAAAGGEWN
jgi:hypothetical protein